MKLATGNFEFKKIYYDNKQQMLCVNFFDQGTEMVESVDNFIHSEHFHLLTVSQVLEIFQQKTLFEKKRKLFSLEQDVDAIDFFTLRNQTTREVQHLLAKDIFLSDHYLENLPAEGIRMVANYILGLENKTANEVLMLPTNEGKVIQFPKL